MKEIIIFLRRPTISKGYRKGQNRRLRSNRVRLVSASQRELPDTGQEIKKLGFETLDFFSKFLVSPRGCTFWEMAW